MQLKYRKSLVDSLEQKLCWIKTSFHPTIVGLHRVWGRNEIEHLIYVLGGSIYMFRQWCSLSMSHRTCENMHGGVGLCGLSMPKGWCTLCMPIYFKPWVIKKHSVQYMVYIELTYVPIKCGIVTLMEMDSLTALAMPCPPSLLFGKLSFVASDATVVVHRGGFLQVLLESFSKGPEGLFYIFLITCKFSTLESIDGPSFVFHGVLILRGNQDVVMVLLPLKWVCMPYLLQIFLMFLYRPWV